MGENVAYTCGIRREALRYRAFSVYHNDKVVSLPEQIDSRGATSFITMVFSGQGSQWAGMGKELIQVNDGFRDDIRAMEKILQGLKVAPTWTIEGDDPPA